MKNKAKQNKVSMKLKPAEPRCPGSNSPLGVHRPGTPSVHLPGRCQCRRDEYHVHCVRCGQTLSIGKPTPTPIDPKTREGLRKLSREMNRFFARYHAKQTKR